jgi:hypothetical protein
MALRQGTQSHKCKTQNNSLEIARVVIADKVNLGVLFLHSWNVRFSVNNQFFSTFCSPNQKKTYLCPSKDAGLHDTGQKKSRVSHLEVSLQTMIKQIEDWLTPNYHFNEVNQQLNN